MICRRTVVRALTVIMFQAGMLAALARASQAAEALQPEIAALAKELVKLPQISRAGAVAVGAFTGPSRIASSAGPGITNLLTEELQKLGVAVKKAADLEIKGDYLPVEDKGTHEVIAKIKGRVLDSRTGDVITEFERAVGGLGGEGDVATLFGLTSNLPMKFGGERSKALAESIAKPKFAAAGTRIAADGSPYAIELLAKEGTEFKPRAAASDEGLAFAKIARGETYAVRLINDSPHDAAVTLSIDGLNIFAFSKVRNQKTGHASYSRVIVPAKSSTTIRGWHRTNESSDSFLVTGYAESAAAAANLPASDAIGTITATFAAAWQGQKDRPQDEPYLAMSDATGFGAPVDAKFTTIKREIGQTRATVSVRYTK